jgi:hypothetical protein
LAIMTRGTYTPTKVQEVQVLHYSDNWIEVKRDVKMTLHGQVMTTTGIKSNMKCSVGNLSLASAFHLSREKGKRVSVLPKGFWEGNSESCQYNRLFQLVVY